MGLKKQTLQPGPCVPGSSAGWLGGGAGSAKAAPAHPPTLQLSRAQPLCSAWMPTGREGGSGGDPGVVSVSVGLLPGSVPCETGTGTSRRCSGVLRGHQSHGLSSCSGWQWEKPGNCHALPVSPSSTAMCSHEGFCGQEGKGNAQTF